MEDHECSLLLERKGTVLGVDTRTQTYQELQTFPHAILWSPQNVHSPKASCTVEEKISRNVGAIKTQGEAFYFAGNIKKYSE